MSCKNNFLVSLPKCSSGYMDLRQEKIQGERFYVSRGAIEGYQKLFRAGHMARVATNDGFKTCPQVSELNSKETAFSRFLKDVWQQQQEDVFQDDLDFNQDVFVPEDLRKTALKISQRDVEFRFTWEVRQIIFQNSLGHKKKRLENICVVRLDYKNVVHNQLIHLREFLHGPSATLLENTADSMLNLSRNLKDGSVIQMGNYPILLHPSVSCVLVHELIGHCAEAFPQRLQHHDLEMLEAHVAPPFVSVEDVACDSQSNVCLPFDDEGIASKTITIVNHGILNEPLLSLESAFVFGSYPNGRGRAQDFRFSPVPRMTNIRLVPGNSSVNDLMSSIQDGLYVVGTLGAINAGDTYQIQCQYGFRVRKGKIEEQINRPLLWGLTRERLMQVEGVAHDFCWVNDGGCLQGEQFLELSGRGAPHCLLRNISVS